jgi:hypothetical protein
MAATQTFYHRLADIQAHLLAGGTVQTQPAALGRGTKTYSRRDVLRFSADTEGLYVHRDSERLCLNTATIILR